MEVELLQSDGYYVVRIPVKDSYSDKNIRKFLDYLEVKRIAAKSQASDKDIEKLSGEITGEWWNKNKESYLHFPGSNS